jgi:hypothetical protein
MYRINQFNSLHFVSVSQVCSSTHFVEHALEFIFEGKVKSLGWEVTENIGKVAAPKCCSSFFLVDPNKTITDTLTTKCKPSDGNFDISAGNLLPYMVLPIFRT